MEKEGKTKGEEDEDEEDEKEKEGFVKEEGRKEEWY